ncbi:hypothetical protein, partial [Vreelandella olivaria]|uniref:hypothetical protein n=1 Tax=Vreelandella olivaria TaxID=390919 RepID=UPI00201F2D3E
MANRFSLSPVQRWCQHSHWGRRSKQWDFKSHEQELGKLSGSDAIVERQGVATAHAGPGPGPAASDLAFRLTLPGGQPPDEPTLAFGLWGVPMSGMHQELTRDVLAHIRNEADGTAITYHLAPEQLGQFYFIRLVVRVRLNGSAATQVYELHRRGRPLPGEWRTLAPLEEGLFNHITPGTWPSMPL